jgi:hypothetical protein
VISYLGNGTFAAETRRFTLEYHQVVFSDLPRSPTSSSSSEPLQRLNDILTEGTASTRAERRGRERKKNGLMLVL